MDRGLRWEVSSPISHLLTSGWVLSQFKTYTTAYLFLLSCCMLTNQLGSVVYKVVTQNDTASLRAAFRVTALL